MSESYLTPHPLESPALSNIYKVVYLVPSQSQKLDRDKSGIAKAIMSALQHMHDLKANVESTSDANAPPHARYPMLFVKPSPDADLFWK